MPIPINPLTISLALQGVNILGNLGANYLDRGQQRKAQREMDRRVGRANLQRALGGNPIVNPVEVKSTGGAQFLRNLGQAAGLGSQAIGLYQGFQQAQKAGQLTDLQLAEARRQQAIGEGMDAALSARSSTALGQGANLAGTALSMGGGTSEAPISSSLYETVVEAPTVTDTRPGYAYGMYKGRQMMEADKYKYGALERQYQQYANIAKQVTDNPRLFRELDADVKKYIMPMLSDETTKIIGLKDLTSGDMDKLASARDALQELYKLREMTVDLQQRGLLGPTGTVSAGFNDQERRLLGEFDTQRTGAMRKLALALNKGALSENDVEAINEAMPDRTALFDETTFGRFDALLGNQISLADSRLKLFSEQNYNIKGLELPDYLQSFVPLTDVYREVQRRGLNR